ncbi:hypothetical protein CALCODRAFT_547562, partial [Calocera cornea HHB12733]
MSYECGSCYALHFIDERVGSKRDPVFPKCCMRAQIKLPPFQCAPPLLAQLLRPNSEDPNARHFKENIQQYNHALSFVSLGAKKDDRVEGGGIYSYRIQGALHHRYGSARPIGNNPPTYNQLYFLDPEAAKQERERRNPNLKPQIIWELGQMLQETHVYAQLYKHAFEVLKEEEDRNQAAGRPNQVVSVRLHVDPRKDPRHYNMPTVDEVAVIIPNTDSNQYRDIVLHNRTDGHLQPMRTGDPAYMPLHYVLAFPNGEHGWYYEMPRADQAIQEENGDMPQLAQHRTRVSEQDYYRYRLHFRNLNWAHHLFMCGRLFQQFIVDAWASVEQNRLYWIEHNQKTIRADLYNGLVDAAAQHDHDHNLSNMGRRVILPATHPTSPRAMHQLYQDSMAIVRHAGRPDIFLTMTANPKWHEIEENLLPGQTAADRPELVARVFNLKRKEVLRLIFKENLFGETGGRVYTIE